MTAIGKKKAKWKSGPRGLSESNGMSDNTIIRRLAKDTAHEDVWPRLQQAGPGARRWASNDAKRERTAMNGEFRNEACTTKQLN
jgi:hypothetical protein